jgi:hypothetical protein
VGCNTHLGECFSGEHELDDDGVLRIDRDDSVFKHIMSLLRDPSSVSDEFLTDALKPYERKLLYTEAQYYRLPLSFTHTSKDVLFTSWAGAEFSWVYDEDAKEHQEAKTVLLTDQASFDRAVQPYEKPSNQFTIAFPKPVTLKSIAKRGRYPKWGPLNVDSLLITTSETEDWKNGKEFAVGDKIDAIDTDSVWLRATVLKVGNQRVFVHYDGYDSKWDMWIDTVFSKVSPCGTKAGLKLKSDAYAALNFHQAHKVYHFKVIAGQLGRRIYSDQQCSFEFMTSEMVKKECFEF